MLVNTAAVARLESCSTESSVAGIGRFPLAPLMASDHRAVRAGVRLGGVGAPRVAPPRSRWVRWSDVDRDTIAAYQSCLETELDTRVAGKFAVGGFCGFGGSANRAAAEVVAAIAAAEDGAVGSKMVALRRGGPTDRYVSAATGNALAAADDARGTLDVAPAHRQRALVDGAAGDSLLVAAIEVFDAEARAAEERARALRDADVADAAFELYISGRVGASQSATQRLHAAVRVAIDRAPKRAGSTHEFEVLAAPDGDDDEDSGGSRCLFDGATRAFLADSMAKMHALEPGDARFCPASLRALGLAHETYVCTAREAECAESRRFARDTQRWAAFDARTRRGERPSDAEWRARCAADMTVAEVKRAISAMSTGTAASPGDGVQPAALKNGGDALHRVLATLFSRVLDTGDVPAVWTAGYVRWLSKGGSELEWLNFRDIVLVSTIGKTFERVKLARLSAWARNVGAVPHLQAGSNAPLGVHHQVHLVCGAAAACAARGEPTWIVLVDITRTFPSTTRSFV